MMVLLMVVYRGGSSMCRRENGSSLMFSRTLARLMRAAKMYEAQRPLIAMQGLLLLLPAWERAEALRCRAMQDFDSMLVNVV
jgi:hypothetical protein